MGISKGAAELFFHETLYEGASSGRVLTLGRQDVHLTPMDLAEVAAKYGFPLTFLGRPLSKNADGHISDVDFFQSLGYDEVVAVDVVEKGSPEIMADLNDNWWKNLAACFTNVSPGFDLVVDGGTLEHVFNVPQALVNIHQVLKVGGKVVHMLPASNFVDHGFWSFSPKLLARYYIGNKYEVKRLALCRCADERKLLGAWEIEEYDPDAQRAKAVGGLDGACYLVACVATKCAESTCDHVPLDI